MTFEQEREVFVQLYRFYLTCKGKECSDDFAKAEFSALKEHQHRIFTKLCNRIELHHITMTEAKGAISVSLLTNRDIWDDLNNDTYLNTIIEKVIGYKRLESDEKFLDEFCKRNNTSIKEIFTVPNGGQSIACSFLRTMLIGPRCYIAHLNEAPMGSNPNKIQVETNNIVAVFSKEVANDW